MLFVQCNWCALMCVSIASVQTRLTRLADGMSVSQIPLEVCESRDPKGLYKLARCGKIKCFTGENTPYNATLPSASVYFLALSFTTALAWLSPSLQQRRCIWATHCPS